MCITSTSFSVIVNGKIRNDFYLERGISQSDPISPCLFYYLCCIFEKIYSFYIRTGSLWSILKFQEIAQKSLTLCLMMILQNFAVLKRLQEILDMFGLLLDFLTTGQRP